MIKLCKKQTKKITFEILTPFHKRWDEFVIQMISSKNSCDNTLRSTGAILWEMQGIDVKGTLEYFESNGCYCDFEVLLIGVLMYSHRDYCIVCNTLTMQDTMINLYCATTV